MKLYPPPSDVLKGYLMRLRGSSGMTLVGGQVPHDFPLGALLCGEITVYYGLALLYEQDFLLPQWVYDDFRREHHGADALDFMLRQGDAFPRADVVGCRASTGQRADLFLKQLDLARGVSAFVLIAPGTPKPFARLDLAVWADLEATGCSEMPLNDGRFPTLLHMAVRCYVASPDWLHELIDGTQLAGEP